MSREWTLRGSTTEYTVGLAEHGGWLELRALGPHGVSDGPSALAWEGKPQYMTPGDVAAVEYAPDGVRPFAGPDLDPGARYEAAGQVYSGAHLMSVGLPVRWTASYDADIFALSPVI